VKVPIDTMNEFKDELMRNLPGIQIEGKDLWFPTIHISIYIGKKTRATQWHALLYCANVIIDHRSE
jgi:hypothetical protein